MSRMVHAGTSAAKSDRTVRLGVIGCGGRGAGSTGIRAYFVANRAQTQSTVSSQRNVLMNQR